MTEPRADRRRQAEDALQARTDRRVERTPYVVVGVLAGLVLLVGATLAVDLRRLDTPRGAALSWTEAAVFGDCTRFRLLSAQPAGRVETRSAEEVCAALRARTSDGRLARVRLVDARPGSAYVVVERPDGQVPARLTLVDDGRWRVVLDDAACATVGCP